MGRIFGGKSVNDDLVARLERIASPAAPREPVGATGFTRPIHHCAVGLRDVDIIMHVRVLPIDASYDAFECDWLGFIVLIAKGMVCESRQAGREKNDACDRDEESVGHGDTSQYSFFSARCKSVRLTSWPPPSRCIIYIVRRTQLYLEDDLWKTLHILARQSGSTVSELVRTAVREKYAGDLTNRKEALLSAIGLWKDRTDLPDAETYVRSLRKGERLKRLTR